MVAGPRVQARLPEELCERRQVDVATKELRLALVRVREASAEVPVV